MSFLFFHRIEAATPSKKISILTYNAWMVDAPFNLSSLDIPARAKAMPQALSETGADVIALQEVWPDKYKIQFIQEFKKYGYIHSFYKNLSSGILYRGYVGNGLLILSKIPLQIPKSNNEVAMSFSDFTRLDEYFSGKGALHVNLLLTEKKVISFYNTHMGAVSFEPEKKTYNLKHESVRQSQGQELFQFIKTTSSSNSMILVGDFNVNFKGSDKENLPALPATDFQRLTCLPISENCLGLKDSFTSIHGDKVTEFTVDAEMNHYIDRSPIYRYHAPKRTLDYIFVSDDAFFKIKSSKIVLKDLLILPDRKESLPLSDHFGVLTELEYQ